MHIIIIVHVHHECRRSVITYRPLIEYGRQRKVLVRFMNMLRFAAIQAVTRRLLMRLV